MGMKKRISISDIAKAMGTSITTVSFILNGKAKERRISESLTRRVLDYVKKVGYKPSQLVRNSRSGQIKIILVLVENIDNPFYLEVLRHVERIASGSGYQVVFAQAGGDHLKTSQFIQLCASKEFDGLLMTAPEDTEGIVSYIRKEHIPTVFFDKIIPDVDIPYVISDNRSGAYDATKHLLETGYKRVGLVSLYSNQMPMRSRLDGYMDAMDQFQQQSFIRKLNLAEAVHEIGDQIIEFIAESKLDAVFFTDYRLAIAGLKALRLHNSPLPAMVAFDDHMAFQLYSPTVTVVLQDAEQVAATLLSTLFLSIDKKLSAVEALKVPCRLIIRESSNLSR